MALPEPFTTAPDAIATFDYQDIESGLGYVTFYAMATSLAAGTEYVLSDDTEYADPIWTERSTAGTTTLTFDSSEFNFPRSVRGTAIFSCGVGGNNMDIDVTAQLQKWNGSSATNISSVITAATYAAGAGTAKMILLQLPCTETLISEGEQLRLVVTLQTNNANVAELGHDPKGRSAGSYLGLDANTTTIMTIKTPFKVE